MKDNQYSFVLNFSDLSEELLDEKFEDYKCYLGDEAEGKSEEELRKDFEYDVKVHFPIYF